MMNRMEEYNELLNELELFTESIETAETTDEVVERTVDRRLEGSLDRAIARQKRKNFVFRPLIGFVASFALFVFWVNVSTTVADACSGIPVLRELAEAVIFSPSLEDAVKNEYAQHLNLFDQDGDASAKVEFLIVDQKQVNIFFRVFSDKYNELYVDPQVSGVEKELESWCMVPHSGDGEEGELQGVTVEFIESDVPSSLKLELDIRAGELLEEVPVTEEEEFYPSGSSEEEYIGHLEFVLEFNPQFTAGGKMIEVNQTVELEGQKIIIENMEIYPTHMRINISDDEENTAWMKDLDFYVKTALGKKFEPVKEGLTATGDGKGKTMTSYRADSTFFYDAKEIELVINGAVWLRKDMEKVYVNLRTKESDPLPEGVELLMTEEKRLGWVVRFKNKYWEKDHFHQIMLSDYYDKEGKEYSFNSWGHGYFDDLTPEEQEKYFIEELRLADYHQDEVWLSPAYSHVWKAEPPIVVEIK